MQHDYIEFTMDKENYNKISFLNVFMDNLHDKLTTSIYKKETFTDVLSIT